MGIHSLGEITVTSAGTPVRVTSGLTDPTAKIRCRAMIFQAIGSNTKIIAVGDSTMTDGSAGVNSGTGVFARVPAPSGGADETDRTALPMVNIASSDAINLLNAADFYLDSEVNGEGCLVSYITG